MIKGMERRSEKENDRLLSILQKNECYPEAPQERLSTVKTTDYINVWQFDNADKKENELTRYLKAQLLDILK